MSSRTATALPVGTFTAEGADTAHLDDPVSNRADTRGTRSRPMRITFPRVLRSEWIKLWSLRSTAITLGSTFLLIVAFGLVAAAVSSGQVENPDGQGAGAEAFGADPLGTLLAGTDLAVLIIGVLGALAGSREYGSGMIRTTLAIVPKRLPVLWARALALLAVVLPLASSAVVLVVLVGNPILEAGGADTVNLSDDGVVRAMIAEAGYITAVALLGLALGFLLRSTAASLGTLIGGLLFLPTLAGVLLPDSWDTVLQYLPSNAGAAMSSVTTSETLLSPAAGALVLLGWVVACLAAAAVTLKARDA